MSGLQRSTPDAELQSILDGWQGSHVVVRVVAATTDQLVAVFAGVLQGRSDEKSPALFWPVESTDPPIAERPGIYLHPDTFVGARLHEGGFVVELEQAAVRTNIRRLDQT